MARDCVFCAIARGSEPASVVFQDDRVLAFVDLRQFHHGHVLVVPRAHVADVRELDDGTGSALMSALSRVARAVGDAFANEGLSIWHSIGPAAFQEVPHLHFHVHPRRSNDRFLRVYPGALPVSTHAEREEIAAKLRPLLRCGYSR